MTNPQIQDQQFAGALQGLGMPVPFSELSPNAGENLTPPVMRSGTPPQHLPEWNRPTNTGSTGDGHKKALLQKLMSNLLSKPGRSMHEIINGVKEAVGAYKNYAKEWDNLNGIGGVTTPAVPSGGSSVGSVQSILKGIQQKKDGGGGPGVNQIQQLPQAPRPSVQPVSPIPQIAGQPQTSSFNRPAPVSSLGIWGY
jgi:hypothetical protein